ncbi:MAG: asparagine synthase (glutamine-hydrolyzing) [Tildeniella nuda ZEHNDER 1965/U140]|jgi:asparagine synthase (glutamine-hydrolysing)|nr:asparagine synthase (glutamine-hydrolyzing) [Tildeniella nuda ZEHNDER 1965/U140]
MCGFAGFVNFHHQTLPRPERSHVLNAMGEQLARRGPDDEQCFDDGTLSFVFRRLAIVDLPGGQQPIWNEAGTLFVAVNGEIYNHWELRSHLREPHTFRTRSDAEIVLHLYEERGADALNLLNGMFAIALWDTTKQQLFLARDRLGIKPLYYSQVGSQLIFGSELKALLVHPACPNRPNWWDLKTPIPQSSYVQGIHLLAAGHYLLYDQSEALKPINYWSLEQHFVTDDRAVYASPDDYVAQYGELFADSVQKRLMSDVPMGIFLSGGVDSSAIAAVAAKLNPDLKCFTVIEPCTIAAGDAIAAQQVANHLQLPFHPVLFDHHQLIPQLDFSLAQFEYFVWMMDSPRFDLEWFFKHELHRYAKTVYPELKVMLLGQGADEFAGGYSNPVQSPATDWQGYLNDLQHSTLTPFFAERNVPESWLPWLEGRVALPVSPRPLNGTLFHGEMLRRIMHLQSHNLWHEDRTSSSQGIEARVPFLDHRLVELLASIPPQYQAELLWDKAIIRRVAQQCLPEPFARRSKSGFFYAATDLSSIHQLMYQLLVQIFPEFCDHYFDMAPPLFAPTRLVELFHQAGSANETSINVTKKLLNCMAMTIFAALCQKRGQDHFIGYLTTPSLLQMDGSFC